MHDQRFRLRRYLLTVVGCAILTAPASISSSADQPAQSPNFLLIFTDDHGYGDVSTYHESDVQTPNIDRLAAEGMLFTAMRANCTVCSPSRAALLTGRYPDRVGVPGVIRTQPDNSWGWFDPQTPTLANELMKAGYHTGIVGKWHLGLASPNTPNERGFDHFHGFLGDMMDSYTTHLRHGNNYLRRNATVIEAKGHATDLFTDWSIDYLRERAKQPEQPFFLYLAYNAPHFPIEPPAEWLAKVKERQPNLDEKRAKNVAFVEHLDDRIGRVLKALKDNGLEQNTVVVFAADNGGSLPHGQNNDPWRDGKQSHYDGGLRVPFLVRWPAEIKPGSRSNYAGLNFDVFPTFLELAGVKPAADLDAVSLVPVLKGNAIEKPRDLYFTRREGGAAYGGKSYEALIRGEWKLLQNDAFSPLELYNLKDDPQERTNLAATNRKIFQELSTALRLHIQRGGQTPWQPPASQASARLRNSGAWKRHVIDDSSKGADGVRLADVNGDGRPDIVTGWEQGGVIRACLNPGPEKSHAKWPTVTVGRAGDVEDAVFTDLDGDGAVDVVSCCEGKTRQVSIHWAPQERERFLIEDAWQTESLPAAANKMMWMFALPLQLDGQHGPDIVAGGKGASAAIGWFAAPKNPRQLADWKWHELRPVGWLMSLVAADMDGDGDADLVFSDRKGKQSGACWLENPGANANQTAAWREHVIGGVGTEAMFLQLADLDQDGLEDVLLAVRPREILWLRRLDRTGQRWQSHSIPLPEQAGSAKAVNAADLDGDGRLELLFSCENAQSPKQGLMWLSSDGPPHAGPWTTHELSGIDGVKHDLIELRDLDEDGDLDVITTEEVKNLGVIWYENPSQSPRRALAN